MLLIIVPAAVPAVIPEIVPAVFSSSVAEIVPAVVPEIVPLPAFAAVVEIDPSVEPYHLSWAFSGNSSPSGRVAKHLGNLAKTVARQRCKFPFRTSRP